MTDHPSTHLAHDRPGPDAVAAATDRIAAELFWRSQPPWELNTRDEVEDLAARTAAEGREPTAHEINEIGRSNGVRATDAHELRDWLSERRIIEHFGHHGANLVSQMILVRAGDILATAAITAFAFVITGGMVDLLRSVSYFLRHLV